MDTCNWTGSSGKVYSYEMYLIDQGWNDVPGNYIFAKETTRGRWTALYVGQTESLSDRLPNHNKRPSAIRNGATHIHAHVNRDVDARLTEEADLIKALQPPCNDQGL